MQRFLKLATILLVIGCLGHLEGQVQIGGYLKSFAYPNLNDPYNLDRLGTRLQLTVSRPFGERGALFAALDFNYDAQLAAREEWHNRQSGLTIYPVEAYLDLYFTNLDLRVGKQFIFWGTTDWINPTDNINPWDYLNISAEIEDYRIPVWAARANLYLNNWTIEGVWVPEFQPHSLPDPPNFRIVTNPPQLQLSYFQGGIRIANQFWNVNVSMNYYQGYDKWPTYRILPFQPRYRIPEMAKQFHWVQIFGGDFITTFGKWAFKGEGAYTLTQDSEGTDPTIRNPQFQSVLGVDYNATDRLTFNLQWVYTRLFKYNRQLEVSAAQAMHRDPRSVPYAEEQAASARIQWSPLDFFTVQLISVYNFRYGDYFLLPILSYDLADGIRVYGGATFFDGPDYSTFGRSKDYSRAFVELKYNF